MQLGIERFRFEPRASGQFGDESSVASAAPSDQKALWAASPGEDSHRFGELFGDPSADRGESIGRGEFCERNVLRAPPPFPELFATETPSRDHFFSGSLLKKFFRSE